MNPTLRNVLVFLLSLVVGSMANMLTLSIGTKIIPAPEGADTSTVEGLAACIHLFQPKHFIFPFLAHAIGTLVGAYLLTKLAASHQFLLAMMLGCIFGAGGLYMIYILPAPLWFNLLDAFVAYLPMAYLGWRLGTKRAS